MPCEYAMGGCPRIKDLTKLRNDGAINDIQYETFRRGLENTCCAPSIPQTLELYKSCPTRKVLLSQ